MSSSFPVVRRAVASLPPLCSTASSRFFGTSFTTTTIRAPRRMASSSSSSSKKDWSAAQYLKFNDERTRAVHDLVSRVPLPGGRLPLRTTDTNSNKPATADLRIVDLGCGPGNSTAVLVDRFPGAHVAGVDSSPNMIERARATLPGVPFSEADLRTYTAPADPPADLLLANAVFQWIGLAERLPTILRLLQSMRAGGVLAYQVPDNFDEPSHRAMRDVARGQAPGTADGVWVPYLRDLVDRDPIETPETIYDTLVPHASSVDVWHTSYYHILAGGAHDIVEWVKGTGLQPFVHALPEDGGVREAFLQAYEDRLKEFYRPRADRSVMIKYPRLFVVAVKK